MRAFYKTMARLNAGCFPRKEKAMRRFEGPLVVGDGNIFMSCFWYPSVRALELHIRGQMIDM